MNDPDATQAPDIFGLYPRIAAGVNVHLTPQDGYVYGRAKANGYREFMVVNQDACRLLGQCRGDRSVAEIISELERTSDEPIDPKVIGRFLAESARRNHMSFEAAPVTRRDDIYTGSESIYIPLHVSVEVTSRCNLKCTYCYNDFAEGDMDRKEIDGPTLIRILDDWRKKGLLGIEITGGEPLLHPDIFEILDYCYEHFAPFALLTNGMLLDDKVADHLATYGRRLLMSISIDGPTAEIHSRTRGEGSFDRVVAAMKRLTERGIAYRAAMTTTPENIWYLEETCDFAREIGASFFGYAPVSPFGRGWDQAWAWRSEDTCKVAEIEQRVQEMNKGFIAVLDENQMSALKHSNCGIGHKNAVISPSGRVTFCLFADRRTYIGDATKQSIEEIFSNPIVPYLRDLPVPSPEDCEGCRYLAICGNCPLRPLVVMEREGRICKWAKKYDVAKYLGLSERVKHSGSAQEGEIFPWDVPQS